MCLCWQKGAVLIISSLLSDLSYLVPMAQLAPALTIGNPWDKARKTGWCGDCLLMCVTYITEIFVQTHWSRMCSTKHQIFAEQENQEGRNGA